MYTNLLVGTLIIVAAALSTTIAEAANTRPNIIVILADDLGYADVGFHEVVADGVKTPNLDRLADSGTIFTNAYSGSCICSSSRLALSAKSSDRFVI